MATNNIYNPDTGIYGYNTPGADLPSGFQPIPAAQPSVGSSIGGAVQDNNTSTSGGAVNSSDKYNINTSSLASTPALTLPSTTPTGNPAAAIISTSQANADAQAKAEANVAKETASLQPLQDQKQGYLDQIKSFIGMETTAQNQAVTDNSAIDPYRKDLADINKTIADTTVAYRGEKDAIMGNGSITKEGQQSLLSNVETKYGRQLADLAIRQSAAQGNVSALEASADRKLKLTLAPIETQIAYYKDFLLANNDQLTKDEKDKINMIISEKDKLVTQHTNESTIANTALKTALENGVKIPDGVVQQILTNPSQAYTILANNGVSLVNPADQAKKYADAAKTRAEASDADPSSVVTVTNPDGTKTTTTSQGVISSDAQGVLEGRNTLYNIRQTMGRTNKAAAYMLKLRNDIRSKDPQFDFVASDAGGKSVSSSYVQKATAAINSVLPNIEKIVELSNEVPRVGITGVDKLLQSGKYIFNDKKVANFHEAQKLIADEIGVALGAGTVSDMKLQLGFDVTDPSVSQEVFASNMSVVREFLQNRKDGLDSLRYKSSTVDNSNGSTYSGITLPH